MNKAFNGVERIKLLGFEIIALIAKDHKESIATIENEIDKCNVVRYLYGKYRNDFYITLDDNSPYNVDDWEKALGDYSGYVQGNESRKYGITNADDGLLLLMALVLDLVEKP